MKDSFNVNFRGILKEDIPYALECLRKFCDHDVPMGKNHMIGFWSSQQPHVSFSIWETKTRYSVVANYGKDDKDGW